MIPTHAPPLAFPKGTPMRLLVAKAVVAVVVAVVAYLALWPVPIDPVAWHAPPAPRLAPDERLRGVERLLAGVAVGPEAIAIDGRGRPCTGARTGRILCLDPATGRYEQLAETGGRPLGLAFDRKTGVLYVCDARKGLLAVSPGGKMETLAIGYAGAPFGLIDDVDVGPDGTVYFSDASTRFGIERTREDVLEHGGRGRLFAYHPATRTTELLLSGLQFANGVAVAGDGSSVLVNETGAYRVTRYWLAGPRRGTAEPFVENLPGLPDNLTWSPARRAFWVALFSPRVPALDALAPYPFLRKVVLRLPRAVQPEPAPHALAVAVDEGGRIVETLQDASPGAFAPVTSVRESGGVLWLGSLERDAMGRIAAPAIPAAAAAAATSTSTSTPTSTSTATSTSTPR
jgi:sugar lactone lactonase YvrE